MIHQLLVATMSASETSFKTVNCLKNSKFIN